ncbi:MULTISPECIES: hypothetical protein [unclassified Granulicatella]|uniref:hypothetical protein n=1 Tax=unclassified Granulicatella TaxID=2630493 RepID=UPI0010734B98|nr:MULTISPECIES: hypothetical protein [unclassified Granulicatella]MBF0780594.1 hypothetical protein [Granulicatella sp. 19428wC4_WM01]TFU94622.1 hypothetical protein E4T68_05725 [Granulicatella sp. WM01]
MTKKDELSTLQQLLLKKEKEKQRCQDILDKTIEQMSKLDDSIEILRAKIITVSLVRQNMTFQDLQELLGQNALNINKQNHVM